jgi:hypothetical protein
LLVFSVSRSEPVGSETFSVAADNNPSGGSRPRLRPGTRESRRNAGASARQLSPSGQVAHTERRGGWRAHNVVTRYGTRRVLRGESFRS